MAYDKSHQLDYRGLEVLAGQFTGVFNGTLDGAVTGVAPITITYTTNNPNITPDSAITIANGTTPTVAELLQFIVEVNAKLNALIAQLD